MNLSRSNPDLERCNEYHPRCLTLLIFCAFAALISLRTSAAAQNGAECTLAGRVINEKSREPLENANVFLAQTAFGTSTDFDGKFHLRTQLTGNFDLVVSLVGFGRKILPLQLKSGDTVSLEIVLSSHLVQEEEVPVVARQPEEWQKNLSRFQNAFIGTGEFADECRLLNPWVVEFKAEGDTLTAMSDSLLWFENSGLGYRMGGIIGTFRWNVKRDEGLWSVHLFFRHLTPESPDQQKTWSENRIRAYRGSLRHFLWAFVRNRVLEEGFKMRTSSWTGWSGGSENSIKLMQHPGSHLLEWRYPGWVAVVFHPPSSNPCLLRLVDEYALIDSSGVLATPLAFELGGGWAKARVGSMLPVDSTPEMEMR